MKLQFWKALIGERKFAKTKNVIWQTYGGLAAFLFGYQIHLQ